MKYLVLMSAFAFVLAGCSGNQPSETDSSSQTAVQTETDGSVAEENRETPSGENIIPNTPVVTGDMPVVNPEVDTVIKTSQVVFPNGGESIEVGREYNIRWESEGIDLVTLELHEDGRLRHTIVEGTLASAKEYPWTPEREMLRDLAYRQYQLVMVDTETGKMHDSSDEAFVLVEAQE